MKHLLLFVFLIACASTPEKKFQKLLQSGRCEEASVNLPYFTARKASATLASVPGKGVSYILTSAAFGVDIVYYVTTGLIIPTAVCAPLVLLSNNTGSPEAAGHCLVGVHRATNQWDSKSIGKKTFEQTSELRCPNLSFAVEQILSVAECFEKNDEKQKALRQLLILRDPKSFGGCVDHNHLRAIEKKIQALES